MIGFIHPSTATAYIQAFGALPEGVEVMERLPASTIRPTFTPNVKMYQPNTPQVRNRLAARADGYQLDELAPKARVSITRLAAFFVCQQWAPE